MHRIFIGWDARESEAADVLTYSLRKHATAPLDIQYLKRDLLDFQRPQDPLQATEFTYTRFLVPWLCGYQGIALFMDCDMLSLGDVGELFALPMDDLALRVVKHDYAPTEKTKMQGQVQTVYPRKNWSSLMLLNCSRLRLWTKSVVQAQTGAYLHRFQDIPDEQIGDLPSTFNTLDCMDDRTRLIHYTSGGPWFPECREHRHADVWLRCRDQWQADLASYVAPPAATCPTLDSAR